MATRERIQILNLELDVEEVSDLRLLVDGKSFKYVTIGPGVYDPGVMVWDRALIPLLPPLPEGDWNQGHIACHPDQGTPYFAQYAKVVLPAIRDLWHTTHIDWLDLQLGQKIMSNVYTATFVKNTLGATSAAADLIVKFARFPWELHYYDDETSFYESIEGQGIGPKFLGHLTEEQRVIGFVLERIKDARHADPGDLEACQNALTKLHQQGILHGDVNKHNFLVREADGRKTVTIVDFECASDCTEEVTLKEELESLQEKLCATDGSGGYYIEEDDG